MGKNENPTQTSSHDEMNVPLEKSGLFSRFYTQNDVLTLFMKSDADKKATASVLESIIGCTHQKVHFGNRYDIDHGLYHQSEKDFEIVHYHLFKGDDYYQKLSPNEIECFIQHVIGYEKKTGRCLDHQTNCILTDDEKELILQEYKKYYQQESSEPIKINHGNIIQQKSKTFYTHIISSAAYKFTTTLLDKYIGPYLISNGYSRSQVSTALESAKIAMMVPLSVTSLQIVFDVVVRSALKSILKYANIDESTQIMINDGISFATNFIALTNPADVVMSASSGAMGLSVGEMAAYSLIETLPKLKIEPAIDHPNTTPEIVREESTTLRHRRHAN